MNHFMKNCISINRAVELAVLSGNSIQNMITGWSEVNGAVYMEKKLTDNIRSLIAVLEPSLRYWHTDRTPHNPSEEGFICDTHKVAIIFPL